MNSPMELVTLMSGFVSHTLGKDKDSNKMGFVSMNEMCVEVHVKPGCGLCVSLWLKVRAV